MVIAAVVAVAWALAAAILVPAPALLRGAVLVAAALAVLALKRFARSHVWLGLALVAAVTGVTLRALPEPAAQQDWIPAHGRQATAHLSADRVVVRDVRNFRYDAAGTVTRAAWEERSYELARLNSAWLGVSTFGGVPGIGHVFASFGFDDGRYLAVSVEARRQQGERYGVVAGAFRKFELVYVIGDERDIVGVRSNVWQDPVYLYPLRTSPEALRAAFLDVLGRATALGARPEFYDTLLNSCSVNLVGHINRAAPGRVPLSPKTLLAALSDALALEIGLIDFQGPLDEARARFRINERAAGPVDDGDFSARIRAGDPAPPYLRR